MNANRIFELRPISIGELLDRVVIFYRHHFRAMVLFSAILSLPITITVFATSVLTNISLLAPDLIATNPALLLSSTMLGFAASLGLGLISAFTTAIQVAGIAVAMRDFVLEGKRSTMREMWAAVRGQLGKIVALVFVLLFFGILLAIPALLVALTIIGIPFVMAAYTFFSFGVTLAYSVLMYENRDAVESLRRGWLLACSGGRRILALLVISFIFSLFIGITFGGLLALAGGIGSVMTENPVFLVAVQPIAQLLILVLINPVQYAAISMLYFDLRVRSEGLDVALISQVAAGEAPDLAAAPTTQETVFGAMPRRAILMLAGVYTVSVVLVCSIFGGIAYLVGTL